MGTSTPVGRMVAEMMVAVAQLERSVVSQRTSAALQVKKAAGVRLGRKVNPDSLAARVRTRALLRQHLPLATISNTLNVEGFTTSTGLAWTWRHVQKTRDSLELDDEARQVSARADRFLAKPEDFRWTAK